MGKSKRAPILSVVSAPNLQHRSGGFVWDKTRKVFIKISRIDYIDNKFALLFNDNTSGTHFLEVDQLNELYPYLGDNYINIKLLYGQRYG